jgi:hypothetical protein
MRYNENKWNIGQTVYFVSQKTEQILPAIVSEEVVIKNLEGEKTVWKLMVGPLEKRKIVTSTSVGTIFPSVDAAVGFLKQNLEEAFQTLAKKAQHCSKLWYKDILNPKSDQRQENIPLEDDYEEEISAAISYPSDEQPRPKNYQINSDASSLTPEEIREKLRRDFLGLDEAQSSKQDFTTEENNAKQNFIKPTESDYSDLSSTEGFSANVNSSTFEINESEQKESSVDNEDVLENQNEEKSKDQAESVDNDSTEEVKQEVA